MGILADIFVTSPEHALKYEEFVREGNVLPPKLYERVEYTNFTDLEFGTLWAILKNEDWDVKHHMLEHIAFGEGNETWLFRFPDELVEILAAMDQSTLSRAAVAWRKTEELSYGDEDLTPVIADLKRLAMLAKSTGKGMYLWGSL